MNSVSQPPTSDDPLEDPDKGGGYLQDDETATAYIDGHVSFEVRGKGGRRAAYQGGGHYLPMIVCALLGVFGALLFLKSVVAGLILIVLGVVLFFAMMAIEDKRRKKP